MAQARGLLYAVWQGGNGTNGVWYSAFNGTTWSGQATIPSALTTAGAAAAGYNHDLYVAWPGKNSSSPVHVFYSAFNGTSWTAQTEIPSALTDLYEAVALASYGGKLYAEWIGSTGGGVWYSAFNGTSWSAQARIPSAVGCSCDEGGPALAVYNTRLFAFWEDQPTGRVAYAAFNGSAWTSPADVINSYIDPLDNLAAATFNKVLYGAWVDPKTEHVTYAFYKGTSWLAETSIPSSTTNSGPGLAPFNGHLYAVWEVSTPGGTGKIDYSAGP